MTCGGNAVSATIRTCGMWTVFCWRPSPVALAVLAHLVARGRRRYRRAGPPGGGPAGRERRALPGIRRGAARCRSAGAPGAGRPYREGPLRVGSRRRAGPAGAGPGHRRGLLPRRRPRPRGPAGAARRRARGAGRHRRGRVRQRGPGGVQHPALTTVGPGREELAGRAVSLLAELTRARAAGAPLPPARHHTVGFRLAEREPSGVPAQ